MSTGASLIDGGRPDACSASPRAALGRYFLLSYLLVLANTAGFLGLARWQGGLATVYLAVVYLTYGAFYLLPVFLPLLVLHRWRARFPAVFWSVAVLGVTSIQLLHHADAMVFRMFGFHFNGFVWNLLVTEAGARGSAARDSPAERAVAGGRVVARGCAGP